MPCVCSRCEQHLRALGLIETPSSRAVLSKAFKAAAKLWHPDRFEQDQASRRLAEERFKQVQEAYRELGEHYENPVEWPIETAFAPKPKGDSVPYPSFGSAPGCFVAPDFSPGAQRIIATEVRDPDQAVAIVDLSGPGSPPGTLAQYILLTRHGIFIRDSMNLLSLLWYDDLGEIRLTDRRKNGRLGFWPKMLERLSGTEQKYRLQIGRRDGGEFYSITGQVDDSIKKVIYNFLQQIRSERHP
jgi:DnaJ domain